jgi:hypothetical protein
VPEILKMPLIVSGSVFVVFLLINLFSKECKEQRRFSKHGFRDAILSPLFLALLLFVFGLLTSSDK